MIEEFCWITINTTREYSFNPDDQNTYDRRVNEHNFRYALVISPSLRKPGARSPNCTIPYRNEYEESLLSLQN